MRHIAIYDLDRTILKRPTFTAFLFFAAGQLGRRLWWRIPLWIAALIGYRMKLFGRKPLKQYGMRLFIGKRLERQQGNAIAADFAKMHVPTGVLPGAARTIAADRAMGRMLVIASAAQQFYVEAIAAALQFDAVIATRNVQNAGGYLHLLDGENCYGAEKLARVEQWLAEQDISRENAYIRFYSDHPSDSPLLDWADEGMLVTAAPKYRMIAKARGWSVQDWS